MCLILSFILVILFFFYARYLRANNPYFESLNPFVFIVGCYVISGLIGCLALLIYLPIINLIAISRGFKIPNAKKFTKRNIKEKNGPKQKKIILLLLLSCGLTFIGMGAQINNQSFLLLGICFLGISVLVLMFSAGQSK